MVLSYRVPNAPPNEGRIVPSSGMVAAAGVVDARRWMLLLLLWLLVLFTKGLQNFSHTRCDPVMAAVTSFRFSVRWTLRGIRSALNARSLSLV